MQVGDTIQFGDYDWRVLATRDKAALIITDKIIDQVRTIINMLKSLGRIARLESISTPSFMTDFPKREKQK